MLWTSPCAPGTATKMTNVMSRNSEHRLSHCARIVRRHDHDRFLTCLFAPASAREDLFALHAFNHEIARVAESVNEPMAGFIRLQWWRDQLTSDSHAHASRGHPVVDPLVAAIRRHGLSQAHLERLIEAREGDLEDDPPETLEDLEIYAEATSATLVHLALEILDARDEDSHAAGRHAGIAWALVGLARAVPFHAAQRRLLLPADLLGTSRVDPHALFEMREPPEVRPVVEAIVARAGEHLAEAATYRPRVPRRAVPALLPATLARKYAKVLARSGHDPFAPRVQMPHPSRPLALAWAAATGRF